MNPKRFIVDKVLEPLMPRERVESYVIFWARLVYRVRKPFIIGITGSVGKSTTTEMVAFVLSHREAQPGVGLVGSTVGNMNDDIGVAATLLRYTHFEIPYAHLGRLGVLCRVPFRALRVVMGRFPKVFVLECGAGDTAHLERVVTIAPPDVSVVTRIGAAHLELLQSVDGVVQEKGALVRAVPASGLVVLGEEHEYVGRLEQMARARVVKVPGKGVELSRNVAREICKHMGVPAGAVAAAIKDFKSPKGRLNLLQLHGMVVIDDTYNANPMSMMLGLDTLAETAGTAHRRLAVLGGMGELGEEKQRYHEEVGAYARTRADVVIGVGDLSRHYQPDIWFETTDACARQIEGHLRADDCVLVKGSASARMWEVVEKLQEIAEKRAVADVKVPAV